jgi:hypothetical protein
MKILDSCAIALAALAGCTQPTPPANQRELADQRIIPTGATIGVDGFATIFDAPPAPFTPTAPGAPPPLTAAQLADHRQFRRASEFQNKVMGEVQALGEKLRSAEAGNFVDLYYENEGEPRVVFRFLRHPAATLAKYTRNPAFVAAPAEYSRQQLRAAMDFMFQTFREDRGIQGGGIGSRENRAVIDVAVPEAEFQALVARKGVKIPDAVKLQFYAQQSATLANAPLPRGIAPLVRIFPRSDRPTGMLNSIDSRAKIVLHGGCFRASDHGDALVLFPMGANLFIDSAGYLAFGAAEAPGYARVGEKIVTPGTIAEVTAPELVGPINAACGQGKVVAIHGMRSAAADNAQSALSDNAQSLRQLREMYGLSQTGAQAALEACKANFGGGRCMLSPPPPMSADQCPSGTKLSFGLCRTPAGHVRPLPKWLERFVGR